MALIIRRRDWIKVLRIEKMGKRWYSRYSKIDWNKLRPMIKQRLEKRAKEYPIKALIPVAEQVLQARSALFHGVSALLKVLPVVTCKHCQEVYVGERGHLIRSCGGHKRLKKDQVHQWVRASLNDVLVPVEAFHLEHLAQDVIKHHQRFDFERLPAVVELCCQAGAYPHDFDLQSSNSMSEATKDIASSEAETLSTNELLTIGNRTLRAWETLRQGVQKLMLVYHAKVCKHCSEVHVGPSGHNARLCGVFKYENWRGSHFWEKASVDDLVPPKMVWYCRPQDPPVLLHEDRYYYGHAPAVVALCCNAGVEPPTKYHCVMKLHGLRGPPPKMVQG